MATVSSDFLAALFTRFDVQFEDQFLAATRVNDYKRLCTVMESKTLTESINWLGTVPVMREWVDTRVHQSIAPSFTYSITNKHYEATIDVDRDSVEDDTYNLIMPRVAQLGLEAGRYPWVLAVNALLNNGTCYDGQPFFSAAHQEQNSGVQSNLVSGTGTTITALQADIGTALAQGRRLRDNQGRPMYLYQVGQPGSDLVVFAPPELEEQFRLILNNQFLVVSVSGAGAAGNVFGTQENPLKGFADLVIDPYLTDTDDWYLLDLGSIAVKPLIYLDRKPPETVARTKVDDPRVFDERMFSWGVDFRGNVGYGWWQTAIRIAQD